MNPIIQAALKDAIALIPENIPDEIATILGTALTHMMESIIQKHLADPEFTTKMGAWVKQAEASKGGSPDEVAKTSAALFELMGE